MVRCVGSLCMSFFFQAEDGIRDLVRSRGLGDVYKRQGLKGSEILFIDDNRENILAAQTLGWNCISVSYTHLTLPTSDLV